MRDSCDTSGACNLNTNCEFYMPLKKEVKMEIMGKHYKNATVCLEMASLICLYFLLFEFLLFSLHFLFCFP